jgi:hypothetical protein
MGKDILAIAAVSIYLVLYCALLQFESTRALALTMLLFAPVVLIVMVYIVLKYGKFTGPELGDNEFGYADKDKDELGVF